MRFGKKDEDATPDDETPKDETPAKDDAEAVKQRLIEAARTLGIPVADDTGSVESVSGSFGLTPNGLEGADLLQMMIDKTFSAARMAGCPPDMIEQFAQTLLGGFAIALAHSLAGVGEIDEDNMLAKIVAMNDQSGEERTEIAKRLCENTGESLGRFKEFTAQIEERMAEREIDTPPLVDPQAAAELAKLFQAEASEGEEKKND